MAGKRRGRLHGRLAALEDHADHVRDEHRSRVVVYLPRKNGDTRPVGVCGQNGNVLTVLIDRDQPEPALPEGW